MKKEDKLVKKLSSILLDQGAISLEESKSLEKALQDSGKPMFVDFLLEGGLVSEADLLKALAQYFKVPGFDVVGYFFNTHLLRMFPENFLIRNACIPIEVDENIMIMVASDPANPELLQRLGQHVSYDIHFRVGIQGDIIAAIREFYDKPFVREPLTADYPDLREKRQLKRDVRRAKDSKETEIVEDVEFIDYSEKKE